MVIQFNALGVTTCVSSIFTTREGPMRDTPTNVNRYQFIARAIPCGCPEWHAILILSKLVS